MHRGIAIQPVGGRGPVVPSRVKDARRNRQLLAGLGMMHMAVDLELHLTLSTLGLCSLWLSSSTDPEQNAKLIDLNHCPRSTLNSWNSRTGRETASFQTIDIGFAPSVFSIVAGPHTR
jgi:hypothetical protein